MSYISIPKESNREGPWCFCALSFCDYSRVYTRALEQGPQLCGAGVRWLQAERNCDPGWMRARLVNEMDTEGRGRDEIVRQPHCI